MLEQIQPFCDAGLFLVPIPPVNNKPTKAPIARGWNLPRIASNPSGYSANAKDFANCQGFNFGLYHGASNTLALDLDDVTLARKIFDELTDLQLLDWLESDQRAEVKSPKANRGKLLFKLPKDCAYASLKQYKIPNGLSENGKPKTKVVFELRCGGCQDVIYGQHPEGGEYQFFGNPAAIPDAPDVLLNMLQYWNNWKLCFDSVLGIESAPPKIATRPLQPYENLSGSRDPIYEFNQSFSVADVLIRNGYEPVGGDRFIRPGSASGAPGAVIMRNCKDGVERVYSHGGDVLNDGHAHDAFDIYRLLECGGEW
jgi:hypothetical protein